MSLVEQLKKDWNDLAEIDPMWAIASVPDKSFGKWNAEEFFETGKMYIEEAKTVISQSGITLTKGTVLDFGCGIGRLTQALAGEFAICYGVDISQKMIELANHYNRVGDRCRYMLNSKDDLKIFESNFFDFVYTAEVLQHIPPDLAKMYLSEFIRILKADGVLMFQVPVRRIVVDKKRIYLRSLPRYHPLRVMNKLQAMSIGHGSVRYYRLRKLGLSKKWLYEHFGLRPCIQMNCLGEREIVNLMATLGATVVRVVEKDHPEMENRIFVVTKKGA